MQAPDAPLSAAAEIRPGAAGSGADAVAPEPQALSADAAGVTAKPEDVWDFFREVNGSRIGGGLEPSIQNGQLGAIASAWAQQQSANGTLQTEADLESKLPGEILGGRQVIYGIYAPSPLDAVYALAAEFGERDWLEDGITDMGIALYEAPGFGGLNRYTLYVIGVGYVHSAPQPDEMTLYRFYRPASGTHFYSTSAAERNRVIGDAAFRYEGQVAYVLQPTVTANGTGALNRFFQPSTGTHFYTSSPAEYDYVRTLPQYSLDGVAGKVYTEAGANRVAMHRFYRPASGTHFYTATDSEVEAVKQIPGYVYEGVAYYLRKAS